MTHNNEHLTVGEANGNSVPADEKQKIFKRGFERKLGFWSALSKESLEITGISTSHRRTGQGLTLRDDGAGRGVAGQS